MRFIFFGIVGSRGAVFWIRASGFRILGPHRRFRCSWLALALKSMGKSVVNQQNPQRDGTGESHVSRKTRDMGHPFSGPGRLATPWSASTWTRNSDCRMAAGRRELAELRSALTGKSARPHTGLCHTGPSSLPPVPTRENQRNFLCSKRI